MSVRCLQLLMLRALAGSSLQCWVPLRCLSLTTMAERTSAGLSDKEAHRPSCSPPLPLIDLRRYALGLWWPPTSFGRRGATRRLVTAGGSPPLPGQLAPRSAPCMRTRCCRWQLMCSQLSLLQHSTRQSDASCPSYLRPYHSGWLGPSC